MPGQGGRRVPVHACVVEVEGRAIVCPGPSRAGKSTLALALQSAGGVILSDEHAMVDPETGWVWPCWRPVNRREPDGSVTQVHVPEPPDDPLPVALVAVLTYRPGARFDVRPLEPADVALALLDNTVTARTEPLPAFRAAMAVARQAQGIGGFRGEAAVVAAALIERLQGGRSADGDAPRRRSRTSSP